MFTGLIEEIGIIEAVNRSKKSARITIKAGKVLEGMKLGDSISTNGVCLTVTCFSHNSFVVDLMAETMRSSNFDKLISGAKVNLERALRADNRLGGHMVSGHTDSIGTIKNFKEEDNAVWLTIAATAETLKYVVHKGSIAIDGVSLTVAYVDEEVFKVSIIPHTKENTTLLYKKVNDEVNLECDVVGKYVEKLLVYRDKVSTKKIIDFKFLSENGF